MTSLRRPHPQSRDPEIGRQLMARERTEGEDQAARPRSPAVPQRPGCLSRGRNSWLGR